MDKWREICSHKINSVITDHVYMLVLHCLIHFVHYVNLLQIIRSDRAVLNCFNLTRNTHNPQAMTEYRGQGLFLNLKLDPSQVCLKELFKKIHFISV